MIATAEVPRALPPGVAEKRRGFCYYNLIDFVKFTYPDYKAKWYHTLLCNVLDMVLIGKIPRLMVFEPPQHGKSEIVSRAFPAYILGREPDARIAACCYSADLAQKFNREVQRKIDTPIYHSIFPDTILNASRIKSDTRGNFLRNTDEFEIVNRRGGYKAVGVGGPLTGNRVDFGIIDDPIKDSVEAQSITFRNRLWDWWTDVFTTRLHNDSRVVFTCTRWHEDDLAGRILNKEEGQWKILLLPGIREPEQDFYKIYPREAILKFADPRAIGAPLWPERHNLEKIQNMRKNSERSYSSMTQQRPAPDEGSMFKKVWLRFYDPAKFLMFERIIQSWDLAFEGKAESDYVACTVWGKIGANLFLLYMTRGKWDFGETIAAIRRITALYPNCAEKLIERKANGSAAINMLQKEISGLIPVDVGSKSKDERAYVATFPFESGNIYFPAGLPWVEEVIQELLTFPHGKHDDIVDTMSQAINRIYRPQGRITMAAI